jgi:hypothetical protein
MLSRRVRKKTSPISAKHGCSEAQWITEGRGAGARFCGPSLIHRYIYIYMGAQFQETFLQLDGFRWHTENEVLDA